MVVQLNQSLNSLSGKHCVVTGGTGLIGRGVVKLLCDAGAIVKSISLDDVVVDPRAEHVSADLTDFSQCQSEISGADAVFHLAGIKGSIEVTKTRPASFLVPLLMFNTNVLEASRRAKVHKLVYTSSIGAYPSAEVFVEEEDSGLPPMDFYPGQAKRIAEQQIYAYREEYGIDWSIVRPCNVYGPGDNFDPDNAMVVPSLMCRILEGETPLLVWGDGTAVRDFAFSEDVAKGVIAALVHGTRGSFVNLGSGRGITIRELVETLAKIIEFKYEFDADRPSGFPRRVMDVSRAREWIGYEHSTSLEHGLRTTWDWFFENQHEYKLRKNYFSSGVTDD